MKENKLNNLEDSNTQTAKETVIGKNQATPSSSLEKEVKNKELFKNFSENKKKKKNFLDEYI